MIHATRDCQWGGWHSARSCIRLICVVGCFCDTPIASARNESRTISSSSALRRTYLKRFSSKPDFVVVAVGAQCKEVREGTGTETHVQITIEQCIARCLAIASCSHFVYAGKLGACGLIKNGTCSPHGPKAGTVSYARVSQRVGVNWKRKADERAEGSDWRCIAPQNRQVNRTIVWRTRAVWYDPGVKTCPRPTGLDAGLCILSPKAGGVRCIPSFVIIGVQKAATRELYSWLRLHTVLGKEGNTRPLPELRYLDKIGSFSNSNSRPRRIGPVRKKIDVLPELGFWRNYVRFFPSWKATKPRGRLPGVSIAASIYAFEKTPSYVTMSSATIRQLRQLFPSMRWILSLRNPTDRMYSWFHMKCADKKAKHGRGYITEVAEGPYAGTVIYNTEAVSLGLAEQSDENVIPAMRHVPCTPATFDRLLFGSTQPNITNHLNTGVAEPLSRGYYGQAIRRWLEHYPQHQLHVLTVDALFSTPLQELRRIEKFLGIDPFEWEPHFRKVGNSTTIKEGTSKVEMHERPAPMSLEARKFLNSHYAMHITELRLALQTYSDVRVPRSWYATSESNVPP